MQTQTSASQPADNATAAARQPLEPLRAEEIRAVVQLIRQSPEFGPRFLFETIELKEPVRREKGDHAADMALPREARVNVFLADEPGLWRLTVSLSGNAILASNYLPTQRPMIQLEQFLEVEAAVRAHPDFIAACARRGIADMQMVCVDPWSAGNFGVAGEHGLHLSHTFCWLRLRENENFYAHPIEGVNAVVDIKAGRVIRVDDYGVTPIPMGESNYEAQFFEEFRLPLKPLDIVQPEGRASCLRATRSAGTAGR